MPRKAFSPTRLALLYTLAGVAWILISDAVAELLVPPGSRLVLAGIAKGIAFVAVTGLVVYVLARREVTRARAAQAALEASEHRFRSQYHDFPIPTFTWRADGDDLTLVDCNAAGLEVSSGRAVVGARAADYFADDPATAAVLRRALADRTTFSIDSPHRSPDGTPRVVRFRASFVPPDLVVVQTADVTAEQHAEQLRSQLLEEERRGRERLSAVLESIQSGFFALDHDWRLTYVNHHAEALFGKPRAEILGRVLWDELPGARDSVFERECRRAASEHVPVAFEEVLASAWLEVHAYPSAEGLSVFVDDVTERRRLAENLERSDALLDMIFQQAPIGFAFLDHALRYMRVNERLAEMNGIPAADHLGRHVHDVIPDLPPEVIAALQSVLDSGVGLTVESGDGALAGAGGRHWWIGGYPVRTADGEIIGLGVLVEDITARKRTEEALRESEARFRTVFEQSAIGIALCDLHGRLLETNPALQRLLGYTADELRGMRFAELMHPDDRTGDPEAAEPLADGRLDDLRSEKRYTRRDGAIIWGAARLSLLRGVDGEPRYLIAMLEDVTQRRALEDELRQAQKMEAVGRLAGGVAHDFNNLLTGIRGYAAMIAGELRPDEPLRADAEEIVRAADRAAALTRQLLAFSRKQVLQPQVLDPAATVANMVRMLRRVIGEDIELVVRAEPDVARVRVDPSQLEQVVLNLAVNARDAMDRGGRLTIETRNLTISAADAADYPGAAPGDYVAIRVHDTGAGIPPEVLPHIFEPFFTTKDPGRGTGLGLATVYGIISQTGGHIYADSTPGAGTSFRILLPAVHEAAPEEAPPPPPRPRGVL
ncbi:MAG: PAS domain S-box protein, partial [Gemmatimonadetes bacterium]|nr:PAS domain S-box protein [Gemmatimonadota bacterium]